MTVRQCIAIFGAGPAGLSAALWLHNLGFDPKVLDAAERAGGLQKLNFLANEWVLGQPGQTGPALAARFVEHARAAGISLRTGLAPVGLDGAAGDFRLRLSDGTTLGCAAVLVATGTRYRAEEVLAGVPGIAEVSAERIAYGPHAFADLALRAGQRVLIVGGGDNAYENARLLAPIVANVTLAMRSRPRAQQGLAADVAAAVVAGRCHVLHPAAISAISASVAGLDVTLAVAGCSRHIAVDRIHVLAGYQPNTAFLRDMLAPELFDALRFDEQRYLLVDAAGRTGMPGLYAAGDVCNPRFPSVVSALAQGAIAAKTIEMDTRTT
jgi:thioredoxin reductase (NADPH)